MNVTCPVSSAGGKDSEWTGAGGFHRTPPRGEIRGIVLGLKPTRCSLTRVLDEEREAAQKNVNGSVIEQAGGGEGGSDALFLLPPLPSSMHYAFSGII